MRKGGIAGNEVAETVGKRVMALTATWPAQMNPNVDQKKIAADMARDPVRYGAEYFSTFRADVSGYVNRDTVEACVSAGITERDPSPDVFEYFGFIDCASGQGSDNMTCAAGHVEGQDEDQCVVIDATRAVKPEFSPTEVCGVFAKLFKRWQRRPSSMRSSPRSRKLLIASC